jgi:phosphoribosylformimino-5-aminoimidazole carboxamide ribotide isomerase
MKFKPCIDIHAGVVKQIVGSTLDSSETSMKENFVSSAPPSYYAE